MHLKICSIILIHLSYALCPEGKLYKKYDYTTVQHSTVKRYSHPDDMSEIQCGRFCTSTDKCAAFAMSEEDSCIVWLDGDAETLVHTVKIVGDDVLSLHSVWVDVQQQDVILTYYIGYNRQENYTISYLQSDPFRFVDQSPIPAKSALVSFLYNASAIGLEYKFGVYRQPDNNTCSDQVVKEWSTTPMSTGMLEAQAGDFEVKAGDYVGITSKSMVGARITPSSSTRLYCTYQNISGLFDLIHAFDIELVFQAKFRLI